MASTLHIDGLLTSVAEQKLKDMFTKFGNVLSVNIEKPVTAGSLCVGDVEMASPGEAAKAVNALHRSYLGGKLLLVFHAPLGTKAEERVALDGYLSPAAYGVTPEQKS